MAERPTSIAEVAAEKKALRLARERVTLARRDITKMIALGLDEAIPGDWAGLHATYLGIIAGLKRSSEGASLTAIAAKLTELAGAIAKHLELFTNSQNSSANESHFERHKQNSKPNLYESEPAFEKDRGEPDVLDSAGAELAAEVPAERPSIGTPLGMVLEACPDILDYAADGEGLGAARGSEPAIRNWAAFLKTAALVRAKFPQL